MAALTTYTPTRGAGVDFADAGATWASSNAGGDTFGPGDDVFLLVLNGSASAVTVTVTPSAGSGPRGTTVAPLALAPTVAATTGHRVYGPFPAIPFADSADGQVHVSCSPQASTVKYAVLKMTSS